VTATVSTAIVLVVVQAAFLLLGLGLTSRVPALRRTGWAVLVAPVAGHLGLALIAIRLSVSVTTGGRAAMAAAAILFAVTVWSWRQARQAVAAFRRHRGLQALALGSIAVQLFACSGLLRAGYATYNGYGTLDAWYYVTDTFLLGNLSYFDVQAPAFLQPHLHTILPVTRVGPQFTALLLSRTGVPDELAAFNVALACFVLLVPIAAGYFAREGLRLPWAWTLLAAAVAGAHSSLGLVYLNQHLGHLLALSVIPVAVATAASALRHRDAARAALAAFLVVGDVYAYWPTAPLVVGPLAGVVLAQAAIGGIPARVARAFALTAAAVVVAASPYLFAQNLRAVVTKRSLVSRNDPVLVAFNPYLTEDLLPLSAGVADIGYLAELSQSEPEERDRPVIVLQVISIAFLAFAAGGVAAELRRRRFLLPSVVAVHGVLVAYVLGQEYGYGLYKLVSWSHVALACAFTVGLRALWRHGRPLGRAAAAASVLALLVFNARTARGYVARSLSAATTRLVITNNFSGNADWKRLEEWSARHADSSFLVAMHSHVAQYWAAFRLRHGTYAHLVPQDVMGGVTLDEQAHHKSVREIPDDRPPVALDPRAVAASGYFLDWAGTADIVDNRITAVPVERSGTFVLYRTSDVARYLSLRHGWYVYENADPVTGRPMRFRWMAPRASLLLFRFPPVLVRLVLGLRAGIGLDDLDRAVTIRHGGRSLGVFRIEGSARIITPPFLPESDLDVVELAVDGEPLPTPRRYTLWNRWVQHDARRLSVGVTDVRAVAADEIPGNGALPRRLSAADVRQALVYDGLHTDGWLGRRFTLTVPPDVRRVRLDVYVARLPGQSEPGAACVRVTGAEPRTVPFLAYGDHRIDIDVPEAAGSAPEIAVEFERVATMATRYLAGLDERRISVRLRAMELSGASGPR
jgi:hypothetical protein